MQIIDAYRKWRARTALRDELCALGPGGRDAVARDVGISTPALERLVASALRQADELPLLMRALSLDPETLDRTKTAVMRDMTTTCSECREVRRCRRNLARGRGAADYERYCPNAETLSALCEEQARARLAGLA